MPHLSHDILIPLMTAALPQAPAPVAVTSIWDFIVKGGVLMVPIGVCSLIAIALIAERSVALRKSRVIPPGFVDSLRGALREGRRERGSEICASSPSPVARIAAAGLRRWSSPIEQVEKHVAEAGQREALLLRKHLRGLSVIAAVCPLLGLLGTIFGMIKAFQTVATSAEALGRTELLAGGIYEAMITTAAGLIVAIPALLAYHFFAAKVERLVLDMDAMCVDLVEQHAHPAANEHRVPSPPARPTPEVAVAAA